MVNQPASHSRTSVRPMREPWHAVASRNRRHTTTGWRRERSPVERALQRLDQVLHIVITKAGRQSQGPGVNRERSCGGICGNHQPPTEKKGHRGFQPSGRTAEVSGPELWGVVGEGKRCARIM